MCEVTPLVYKKQLIVMECIHPHIRLRCDDSYLTLRDEKSGKVIARFADGFAMGSAIVNDDQVYVFASRCEEAQIQQNNQGNKKKQTWNDVTLFYSKDLKQWKKRRVLLQTSDEHLFNTSVCASGDRFIMAYETNDPKYKPFTIKFAESKDLIHWTKIPNAIFGGDRYTACPCLRYIDGYYYMLYLERKSPAWRFEIFAARSHDLKNWELSQSNPIIAPDASEGINTSDPDVVEFKGKVYLYYCIGDQKTYKNMKRAIFNGTLKKFFKWCFRPYRKSTSILF